MMQVLKTPENPSPFTQLVPAGLAFLLIMSRFSVPALNFNSIFGCFPGVI